MFSNSLNSQASTLRQFTSDLARLIHSSQITQNRWVIAELSDVAVRGGHCYLELIEKDDARTTVAKLRATIWASRFANYVKPKFESATRKPLSKGIKVMVCGSANFHEQFGLSFNITDIDPSYTMGDMERIRREIIMQLTREGVINNNKALSAPIAPQRIAVISAPQAAGYGDFMNQLVSNQAGFIFYTHLFEAIVQGERTAASVLRALDEIEMSIDLWDYVVIIRGGGASSDLEGFDNLELARRVATFQLPVIVGIGHERDRTVLDEIAHTRVKTPTAAAEFLISGLQDVFERTCSLVENITRVATDKISGSRQQLSYLEGMIPLAVAKQLSVNRNRLDNLASSLPLIIKNRLVSVDKTLDALSSKIQMSAKQILIKENGCLDLKRQLVAQSVNMIIQRETQKLRQAENMVEILSPHNTLKRGYSITRINGKAVKSESEIKPGDVITTTLSDGKITSIVK